MKYNKALDHMALAVAAYRKGKVELATEQFIKACTASDTFKAVAIIEASNKDAYQAEITAAAEAKKIAAKAEKPTKPKAVIEASKRLQASEDDLVEDEPVVEDVVEEDVDMEDSDADDDMSVDEIVDDEEEMNKEFAKVLATMTKKRNGK